VAAIGLIRTYPNRDRFTRCSFYRLYNAKGSGGAAFRAVRCTAIRQRLKSLSGAFFYALIITSSILKSLAACTA
jgi:hypothetical protein